MLRMRKLFHFYFSPPEKMADEIGPCLPSNLRKKTSQDVESPLVADASPEEVYGPILPGNFNTKKETEEATTDDVAHQTETITYGPALPPGLVRNKGPIGPELPPGWSAGKGSEGVFLIYLYSSARATSKVHYCLIKAAVQQVFSSILLSRQVGPLPSLPTPLDKSASMGVGQLSSGPTYPAAILTYVGTRLATLQTSLQSQRSY